MTSTAKPCVLRASSWPSRAYWPTTLGTATGCVPLETTSVTSEPASAFSPAPGMVRITEPSGTVCGELLGRLDLEALLLEGLLGVLLGVVVDVGHHLLRRALRDAHRDGRALVGLHARRPGPGRRPGPAARLLTKRWMSARKPCALSDASGPWSPASPTTRARSPGGLLESKPPSAATDQPAGDAQQRDRGHDPGPALGLAPVLRVARLAGPARHVAGAVGQRRRDAGRPTAPKATVPGPSAAPLAIRSRAASSAAMNSSASA